MRPPDRAAFYFMKYGKELMSWLCVITEEGYIYQTGVYLLNPPSDYEAKQIEAVKSWKDEEPGVVSKSLGTVAAPITWLAQKVIPAKAIQGAIDAVDFAAERLANSAGIKKEAEVSQIRELRNKDLELSDKLANKVHNWAIGMATTEGTVAGVGGFVTLAADVPAVIVLALRTIYKIGLCYGFEFRNKRDKQFILGILAVSGANSKGDKVLALEKLRGIELAPLDPTEKNLTKPAVDQKSGETEIPRFSIDHLSKTIGMNLTKRKALQLIPGVGALVGGSVNGWYIKDVGWAARRCFQERWLIENLKWNPRL